MTLQEKVRANWARRAITFPLIVVLGSAAGVFFGRFYFVRELVLFICVTAIVVFLAASLMVLGIVVHVAGQSLFQAIRKMKPVAAKEKPMLNVRRVRSVGLPE